MTDPNYSGVRSDRFLSVVVVGAEPAEAHETALRAAHDDLADHYANYEIIVVDNGALPGQVAIWRRLLRELDCIRVLRLSGRYSSDTAILAGVEAAIGDTVVVFDPSTDPVGAIRELEALSAEGHDIVQGIVDRAPRGRGLSRLGRRLFYWYNRRVLGVAMSARATHLTALSRRAVNSLSTASRAHRYFRHLLHHIGFPIVEYVYSPDPRSSRRSLRSSAWDAIEMVSSYSTHPLRVVTVVGLVAAGLNVVYAVYVVVVNILAETAEGWTTTSLQLSLMFFVICLILAIQSEYLGRVLRESRREPDYFLLEELESDRLIPDEARRNVVD